MEFLDQIIPLGLLVAVMTFFTWSTNKRIDDFKESIKDLLEAKIRPLQDQIENHIPTAIKQVAEDSKKRDDELKKNQEKIQKTNEQILNLLKKLTKES